MRSRIFLIVAALMTVWLFFGATKSRAIESPIDCNSSISPNSVQRGQSFSVSFTVRISPDNVYCNSKNADGVPDCVDMTYCLLADNGGCQETYNIEDNGKVNVTNNNGVYTFTHNKTESKPGKWKYTIFINQPTGATRLFCVNTNTLVVKNEEAPQSAQPVCTCPEGYTTNPLDAPFGTDFSKKCSKRLGLANYEVVDNICKSAGSEVAVPFDICNQVNTADKRRCNLCLCGADDCKGKSVAPGEIKIWTSIGCIPASKQGIVESLLRVGLGLSGGVLVIMILAGAFNLATSAGETKKVQEGQEMISAAVIGLLFVIFSVIILRFIVVSVLRIPGFGS